jgi:hypothetical protein
MQSVLLSATGWERKVVPELETPSQYSAAGGNSLFLLADGALERHQAGQRGSSAESMRLFE